MIGHEPPSVAVAPLPLWPTVAAAFRLVFGNFGALAKVCALPFVLLLLIEGLATLLGPIGYAVVWEFGTELPWTLMAVAWLRLLLLPASEDAAFFPRLRPRHLRFLGYALLLSAISLPRTFFAPLADFLALEGTERSVAYWALYVLVFYLGLRFSFVYAAAAVDEPYSLSLAWRHTRRIAGPLFLVVGLTVVLPGYLFELLVAHLMQAGDTAAFAAALLWVTEALYLAFFAVALRTCTGWVPAPDPDVLQRFD